MATPRSIVWTPAASPPPFLILHGAGDKTVPYAQAAAMAEKLKAAGAPARLFTAPDAPHTFWASKQWYWPTLKAMESFLLDIFSK